MKHLKINGKRKQFVGVLISLQPLTNPRSQGICHSQRIGVYSVLSLIENRCLFCVVTHREQVSILCCHCRISSMLCTSLTYIICYRRYFKIVTKSIRSLTDHKVEDRQKTQYQNTQLCLYLLEYIIYGASRGVFRISQGGGGEI